MAAVMVRSSSHGLAQGVGACSIRRRKSKSVKMKSEKNPALILSEEFWGIAQGKLEDARFLKAQAIESRQQFREGTWRLDPARKPTWEFQQGIRQRDISPELDQLPHYLDLLSEVFDRCEEIIDKRVVSEEFIRLYGDLSECIGFLMDRLFDDSDELRSSRKSNGKPVEDHLTWYCKAITGHLTQGKTLAAARNAVRDIVDQRSSGPKGGKFGADWFAQFYTKDGDIRRVFLDLNETEIRDRAHDQFADIPDV